MKLVVFVKAGLSPIVARTDGGGDAATGAADAGASSNSGSTWGAQRYTSLVEQHLLSHHSSRRLLLRPGGIKLLHDRDPAHTANAFTNWAASKNMQVVALPAKAADLDPLDYGVFGPVKTAWKRQVMEQHMTWQQQCDLLVQLLHDYDPTAAIHQLPSRIQRCIDADGWHFEG